MDPHRALGAPRSSDRGSGLARESACRNRLRLGLLQVAEKKLAGFGETRPHLCAQRRVFRWGYGVVPAALSQLVPADAAPTLAFIE